MAGVNSTLRSYISTDHFSNIYAKGACTRYPVFELTFGKGEGIFWVLISILTLVVNAASIFTLIKSKRRNTNHSIFLVSLLASNVVHAAAVTPVEAYACFSDGIPCSASNAGIAIAFQTILISLMSVAAVAVDRFTALKGLATRTCANRIVVIARKANLNALLVVSGIWIACSLVGISLWMEAVEQTPVGCLVLLMFIVTVSLLLMVCRRLRRFSKGVPTLQTSSQTARKTKASMKLMMSIVCCILLLWLPATVLKVLENERVIIPNKKTMLVSKLLFLSPLFDPINYVLHRYYGWFKQVLSSCISKDQQIST